MYIYGKWKFILIAWIWGTFSTYFLLNNYETKDIIQNAVITISSEDNTTLQLNIDNEIQLKQDVQIEKITSENSAILNNKTSAELSDLFTRIVQRFEYVYGNYDMSNIIMNSQATTP